MSDDENKLAREILQAAYLMAKSKQPGVQEYVAAYLALRNARPVVAVALKQSADDDLLSEIAALRKVVAARIVRDIVQHNLRVEYNGADEVYNLFSNGRFHSWWSTPEEVDSAVVSILGITPIERTTIEKAMLRNAIGTPIVIDNANGVPSTDRVGDRRG